MHRVLFIILIFTFGVSCEGNCFSRSNCDLKIGSECFVHIKENVNWFDAEKCCVAWGGHLASINSYTENMMLDMILDPDRFTWIGLKYNTGNNKFEWTDGTTTSDYNNRESQMGQADESCYYSLGSSEYWIHSECNITTIGNMRSSYICKNSIPDAPQNLTATYVTSNSIKICFYPPPCINQNCSISSFNISYQGMTFDESKKNYTLNVNPIYPLREYFCTNLTGLQEYNNYTIAVSAVNAAGTGPESTPITFLTKQAVSDAPPQNITAKYITSNSIKICFHPPTCINQNGPISSFNISYHGTIFDVSKKNYTLKINIIYPLKGNFCTNLTNLQEYNNYTITVSAVNAAGTGPESRPLTFLTEQTVPDAPPQNLTVTYITSNSIKICFHPPPCINQNGPISSFNISYQGMTFDISKATYILQVNSKYPSNGNFCTNLTGLQEYNNYTITVSAVNAAGTGPESSSNIHITEQADSIPKIITPSANRTEIVDVFGTNIGSIRCVATGKPTPEVHWTQNLETRLTDSDTLHVDIVDVIRDDNKVLFCVAQNKLGRDVVSITYKIKKSANDFKDGLEKLRSELNNAKFISEETTQKNLVILELIDSIFADTSLEDEIVRQILESAVEVIKLMIEKGNETLSNQSINSITNSLSRIVERNAILEDRNQTEGMPEEQSTTVATISTLLASTLNTIEIFLMRLSEERNINDSDVLIINSELITIVVQTVRFQNDDVAHIAIPDRTSTNMEYSVSLQLPVNAIGSQDNVSILVAIIKNSRRNMTSSTVPVQGSDIIVVTLSGKSGRVYLDEEVTISFDVFSDTPSESTCVFLNGTSWLSEGLTTVEISSNRTTCISPHLTSFAVLVTPQKSGSTTSIELSVISYVIVGISFLALSVSLILFLYARKPFFKVEINIIYFNYCLSMLLATGLFIFGIQVGTFHIVLCKTVAFLLHYSWLAVFTWTLCLGMYIMYKIVIGVISNRKIYPFLICFGWGFPIIIPVITLGIKNDNYVNESRHCFLTPEGGVIWTFIGPILLILTINTLLLIIAIIRIIHIRSSSKDNNIVSNVKSALITGLILTPVLGLPWLILIFNIIFHNVVLEWIFIIVNGLMGLGFFVLVAIRNKQVLVKFRRNTEEYSMKPQPKPTAKSPKRRPEVARKSSTGEFRKKREESFAADEIFLNEFAIGDITTKKLIEGEENVNAIDVMNNKIISNTNYKPSDRNLAHGDLGFHNTNAIYNSPPINDEIITKI